MFLKISEEYILKAKKFGAKALKWPAFEYEENEDYLKKIVFSEWSEYELWLFRNRLFTIQSLKNLYRKARQFKNKPRVSILMPVYNPDPFEFRQSINSILWQCYPEWELCLVDDYSDNKDYLKPLGRFRDRRIKVQLKSYRGGITDTIQKAFEMASGEFVALMDQDDELYPDAIFSFVELLQNTDIDYFYSDRDMISPQGKRYMHFFKPDWSPEYLLSFNYLSHFEIYNKQIIQDAGGFREECEGSQDYDLALRVTERTNKIYHHPMVLYSWRQSLKSIAYDQDIKSYVYASGIRAINDAVKRRSLLVEEIVEENSLWRGHYRIVWDKRFFSDKRITFIVIGQNEEEICRLNKLFDFLRDSFPNIRFFSTNHNVHNINSILRNIDDEYVFFCDDSVADIVSSGFIDMLGYLSISGVAAVGCKFIDLNETIFNVGLSITNSGDILFNYRGSPLSEQGYGAVAAVPRNVSSVFPAFWGCKISSLRKNEYLNEDGDYFSSALDFFIDIQKSDERLVCMPYMCLKIYTDRIKYEDSSTFFKKRWLREGLKDKYYNPNLTDTHEDFGIKI